MNVRGNLFRKLNLGLALMFLVIMAVYGIAHQRTTAILQDEIRRSNLQKLMLLAGELDSKVRQMADFQLILLTDSSVKQFASLYMDPLDYDRIENRSAIRGTMAYKENTFAQWKSSYAVYSVFNDELIALDNRVYRKELFTDRLSAKWELLPEGGAETGDNGRNFYKFALDGIIRNNKALHATTIVGASFPESNIRDTLDRATEVDRGTMLLYDMEDQYIEGSRKEEKLTALIIGQLKGRTVGDSFQFTFGAERRHFLVTGVKSDSLGWHIVDCTPLSDAMKPLSVVNLFFYAVFVLLFIISIVMSYMLYRQVLSPMKTLMRGLKAIQSGQYSVRIKTERKDEFHFVFDRFNEMSKQIGTLIEHVLKEQLRAKDAYLKQLQAQINPHFLYNSIGFMINMIEMKQDKVAVSMAHNLSDYYRYMTRIDMTEVQLSSEIGAVMNYLDIQRMRNPRLGIEIDIPEELHGQLVPRLILQPLVENAVMHGLRGSVRPAVIAIRGGMEGNRTWIEVADNGRGMAEPELEALRSAMLAPEDPPVGYGLWNVRQRLAHRYPAGAELAIEQAPVGGLIVRLMWIEWDQSGPLDPEEGEQ
ncbi:histidine kinase [Paenibacillus sp. LHD-117]|uniref:sensor histidine kinase n=1 Tax=Paenibacillus sp. LHD-117 TaxID=3071412 RepID=UPI0027E05764|nr:histidine kinase [Paenibacillus sp. LHD-117]MDQ6421568.1 histidine kinase [Paenibacillus sp. LHD-117]